MIKLTETQTIATFGTGDIGLIQGTRKGDGMQCVGFMNQSPREIGSEEEYAIGEAIDTREMQILFEFTKVESIEAVIKILEAAKTEMLAPITADKEADQ